MEEGFNKPEKDGTTRMGFDMVVCKKNMHEVKKLCDIAEKIIYGLYSPFIFLAAEVTKKILINL